MCRPVTLRLIVLPPLPSGRERSASLIFRLGPMVALTHWVCFPFFISELLMSWPTRLSVVFRRLVRLGSFPAGWRQANVTQIPKGQPSSSVANYRPISITSVLSKVFELPVSVHRTQWPASNHPVSLPEMFGYLSCTFVCVLYTAKCTGEWAVGWDREDSFQCSLR